MLSKKLILLIFAVFVLIFAGLAVFLFVGKAPQVQDIKWGAVFSQKHATLLGLDWKEAYLALLDDLGVRQLKVAAYWDLIEKEDDKYDFEDLDWQIEQASKRGADILLVLGRKVPRWPECHEPDWLKNQSSKAKGQKLLEYVAETIKRYKDESAIWGWQVENEPLFSFGECELWGEEFLKREVELVKDLDSKNRPIVISDSGEFSLWLKPAQIGDMVGATLYRFVWSQDLKRYVQYPFPPVYYYRRALLIKTIFGKKVINVELQLEPWGRGVLIYDIPLQEQKELMNVGRFKQFLSYARATGLDQFYLWGAEWMYWLKENHGDESLWAEAKKLYGVREF